MKKGEMVQKRVKIARRWIINPNRGVNVAIYCVGNSRGAKCGKKLCLCEMQKFAVEQFTLYPI